MEIRKGGDRRGRTEEGKENGRVGKLIERESVERKEEEK